MQILVLIYFLIALAVGFASYLLTRFLLRVAVIVSLILSGTGLLLLGSFDMMAFSFALQGLLLGCVISIAGAFAEKNSKKPSTFASSYKFMATATILSFEVGYALASLLNFGFRNTQERSAYFIGLLITPVAIAVIMWMLHSAKLRPGIDRHLQEGESDPQ